MVQIPQSMAAFLALSQTVATNLVDYLDILGLTEADRTPLTLANTALSMKLTAVEQAKVAYHGMVADKDATYKDTDEILRSLIRRIQASPNINDTIRENLGLKKVDTQPSAPEEPVIKEAPIIIVESRPGEVILHFGTNPTSPRMNRKPAWATGCKIYRKLEGESEWTMIGFETKSPFIDEYFGPVTQASYYARYQGKKSNDLGPVSQMVSIAASGLPQAA